MRIFGGSHKNQSIITKKGSETRPTSGLLREALFNICQTYIEGATFLDLFAGSGAMGLEALSRGATFATFIESDREALCCIKKNLETLNFMGKGLALHGDVFHLLAMFLKQKKRFSMIYADPPYDSYIKSPEGSVSFSTHLLHFIDKSDLLESGGMLFIEESRDAMPQTEGLTTLTFVSSRIKGRSSLQQYKK